MSVRLVGTARVPGDKSTAHRALILAALARGPSRLCGLPESLDVRATLSALEALGARFEDEEGATCVLPASEWVQDLELDAGNSGTTARLLAGALAARRCAARIVGDASLSARPMERVAEPLRALGADVRTSDGRLPLVVRPASLTAVDWEAAVPSAQVKSAFLFAATGAPGTSRHREPVPTRDHGERLLREFGAEVDVDGEGWLRLRGPADLRGTELRVAGDPSSAAVLLTAAILLPGSELRVEDVDLSPTRLGFVRVLQRMGARLVAEAEGALVASSSRLRATIVEPEEVPSLVDEVPLLALAAARADGETTFRGLGELRHKESDRLAAIVDLLERLGVPARLAGDDLVVVGGRLSRPVRLDPRGDHRLAMLGAVLELLLPGAGCRDEPCVAVSWPSFYDDLRALTRPGGAE